MKRRRLVLAAAGLLVLLGTRHASAAASCAASCVARMASCRAERCPGATGKERRHCRDVCRAVTGCAAGAARIRTLATVVNECRSSGGMWTGRQRLEIRRGNCPPLTVMTIDAAVPAPDPLGICRLYGEQRDGSVAMSIGAFQGLAVSPDGNAVLFAVTDDFLGSLMIPGFTVRSPAFMAPSEGVFVVRSDGSGLRRIADQSREAPFAVRPGSNFPFVRIFVSNGFSFSPDGRSVVFTDRGPGSDGSDAPQVFILDVDTGDRRQVTTFTAASVGHNPDGIEMNAVFVDDEVLGVFVFDSGVGTRLFTVRRDGSDIQPFEPPLVAPGAHVVPDFHLAGASKQIASLELDEMTDVPRPGPVREVFIRDGKKVLQLTRIGRSDTGWARRLTGTHRVSFASSGNPLGGNPSNTCQLFTVDRLGGHMSQLTHFDPGATSPAGCRGGTNIGCTSVSSGVTQDPRTGALVFDSSCDPFAITAVGEQLFAIRPDGSGLRQITSHRGVTIAPDGTVDVELPGPFAYSAPTL